METEVQSATNQIETPLYTLNKHGNKQWTQHGLKAIIDASKKMTNITIAKEFGCTIGSIAGILSRAREKGLLPPANGTHPRIRKTFKEPEPKNPSVRLIKLMEIKPEKPHRVRLKLIESPTAVTFEQLESHHCRWPDGDPKLPDFRFCGGRVVKGKPYCAEHVAKAGRHYQVEEE